MKLLGSLSRGAWAARLCLALLLGVGGCAGNPGPVGQDNGVGLPDPDQPVSIPLDEVRVVSLEGIYFNPQISVINSSEELANFVEDPAAIGIDFETETAVWIGWYLPDPCTTKSLISLSKSFSVDELVVRYDLERDPNQFCQQIIVPFEELLIFHKCNPVARLFVDEELIASSDNE